VIREALGSHRTSMRPRRKVSPVTLRLLRPLFRRSWERDAWILRGVGNRRGPVLVRKGIKPNVEDMPERPEDLSPQRGRFARPPERTEQVGENRQVGGEPDSLKATDAEGE
jgi:hypothetical protein